MAPPEVPDAILAERVRTALVFDPRLHELGVRVVVRSAARRVTLAGVVATRQRRVWIAEVVGTVLPGFEIHNDVAVQQLAPPETESLA